MFLIVGEEASQNRNCSPSTSNTSNIRVSESHIEKLPNTSVTLRQDHAEKVPSIQNNNILPGSSNSSNVSEFVVNNIGVYIKKNFISGFYKNNVGNSK